MSISTLISYQQFIRKTPQSLDFGANFWGVVYLLDKGFAKLAITI